MKKVILCGGFYDAKNEKLLRDTSDKVCAEYYAPDAQWFIKRTPFYGFAVKGGCNNEHHNHNDVGSFIFAKKALTKAIAFFKRRLLLSISNMSST